MTSDIANTGIISFDYPFIFLCFLIFIPLILLDILSSRKKNKLPENLQKKTYISNILFYLFLTFTIIALSGPRWGIGYGVSEYRRGLDIVFAIDVSRSMDIRDVPGSAVGSQAAMQSRLERGLLIAENTVLTVSGARFAAAIGRNRGYLAVPLTYDTETITAFLESLNNSPMTGRSTNLESLVETAASAFIQSSAARRVIVLISDGEAHSGELRNAINSCIREGIIICSVAVGSEEGRQIPQQADNPQSNMVISRRDSALMRAAAERTGIYIDGNRDDASHSISGYLLSLAQENENHDSRKEQKQRHILFIILALITYSASKFVTRRFRMPFFSIIFITFFFTSCLDGKLILMEANYLNSLGRHSEAEAAYRRALNYDKASAYAEYGLGLTFYSLDDNNTALRRYDNSQKLLENYSNNEHRELRYRNFYNSGIVFFEEEDYHSAAAAFREALRIEPRRIEAKRNLELSLLSITMETNSPERTDERLEQREILFEYIKQEEQQYWRSREWAPEENFIGPDY